MKNSTASLSMRILGAFLLFTTLSFRFLEPVLAYEIKTAIVQDELLARDFMKNPDAMKELVALQSKIAKFDEKKRKALRIQTENYLKKFEKTEIATLDSKTRDKLLVMNYLLQVLKEQEKKLPIGRQYWLTKINSVSAIPVKWSDIMDQLAQKYAENYAKTGSVGSRDTFVDLAKNWYDCKTAGRLAIQNYSFDRLGQKIMKDYIIPATSF